MGGVSTYSDPETTRDTDAPTDLPVIHRAGASSVEPMTAGRDGAGEARRMVIVPRRPGLLRPYEVAQQRPRDELDDVIDDLFGATTDEKPGPFDVGLVVVGLGLAAWGVIFGGPALALWLGIAAIVLGLALPLRAALRRYGWSRTGGLRRRIIDGGLLLDASQPATVALIDAYAHVIQMSCLQGIGDPKRAVTAGHMAVVEVAKYLDGRPPETPSMIRFVSVRTDALEKLTRRMMRSHDRWAAKTAAQLSVPDEVGGGEPAATSPWESLNALGQTEALAELEKLNQQLRRETAVEAD
jgi:hypothetical protein